MRRLLLALSWLVMAGPALGQTAPGIAGEAMPGTGAVLPATSTTTGRQIKLPEVVTLCGGAPDYVVCAGTGGGGGGTVTTTPLAVTSTSVGGTIAQANTFQSALAANGSRKGCFIVAKSTAVLSIYIGAPGSATAAAAIDLQPGVAFSCVSGGIVLADQISIASATAGATFVVVSQ